MGREDSCTDSQTVNLNTTDYARVGNDRKPDLRATSDLFLVNCGKILFPTFIFFFNLLCLTVLLVATIILTNLFARNNLQLFCLKSVLECIILNVGNLYLTYV